MLHRPFIPRTGLRDLMPGAENHRVSNIDTSEWMGAIPGYKMFEADTPVCKELPKYFYF